MTPLEKLIESIGNLGNRPDLRALKAGLHEERQRIERENLLLREFCEEVTLGVWSDSEPESLLRTLAARARALLEPERAATESVKTEENNG